MLVGRFTFENYQIKLSPCFIFISKTSVGLPKTQVSFCSFLYLRSSSRYDVIRQKPIIISGLTLSFNIFKPKAVILTENTLK